MKRVFLSFKMEDKKQVDGIRLMAWNERFALEFYDESVRVPYDSENAGYIRSKIKDKIRRSSVAVGFLSTTTHESKWVNWELETARSLEKKIILMGLPRGPNQLRVPSSVGDLKWYLWDPDELKRQIEAA